MALNSDASTVASAQGPALNDHLLDDFYMQWGNDTSLDLDCTTSNTVLNGVGLDDNATPFTIRGTTCSQFGNSLIELHNIVIDNATPTLISLTLTPSPLSFQWIP